MTALVCTAHLYLVLSQQGLRAICVVLHSHLFIPPDPSFCRYLCGSEHVGSRWLTKGIQVMVLRMPPKTKEETGW